MQQEVEAWLVAVIASHPNDDGACHFEATAKDEVASRRPLSNHGGPQREIDDAKFWSDHLVGRLRFQPDVHLEHLMRPGVERQCLLRRRRHPLRLGLPEGGGCSSVRKTRGRVW